MNYQEEIEKIAEWMKNYANNAGAKGYVVGVSGGVDSSTILYLTQKAVGKENVKAIIMPCYSNPQFEVDAQKLCENLDVKWTAIYLESIFDQFVNISKIISKEENKIALGNIKAKIRMTMLYDIAYHNNMLVAGTGNLSELMIGYCSKHGDAAVDLEPIGEWYKTEVYEMAKLIPEIPQEIIDKKPSADLWGGQTDEDELGMTYRELDDILMALDSGCFSNLDKFPSERVEKVQNMIKKSKHKREMPPTCPRSQL